MQRQDLYDIRASISPTVRTLHAKAARSYGIDYDRKNNGYDYDYNDKQYDEQYGSYHNLNDKYFDDRLSLIPLWRPCLFKLLCL